MIHFDFDMTMSLQAQPYLSLTCCGNVLSCRESVHIINITSYHGRIVMQTIGDKHVIITILQKTSLHYKDEPLVDAMAALRVWHECAHVQLCKEECSMCLWVYVLYATSMPIILDCLPYNPDVDSMR